MGYLLNISLAALVLAVPDFGWRSPLIEPLACCALLALPWVLGLLAGRLQRVGRFRAANLALAALAFSPPLAYAGQVVLLGWSASVQLWLGREVQFLGWADIGQPLAFLPFVALQLCAIHVRARVMHEREGAKRVAGFQQRMFFSALVPISLAFGVSLLVGQSSELRTRIEQIALYDGLYSAVLLAVMALSLPFLLRNTWETEPVPPGPARELLESVARACRFRARELLVWRTGGSMANAAIVGLGPRTRVVLFSDLLLAELDARELAAVFAHEIGHAVRRHVFVFVLLAAGFFLWADLALGFLGDEVQVDELWLAAGSAAAVGGLYLGFGWLSRRFELEADLYSLEVLRDPGALISALEKVGGHFRDVASWRHFSTARRVDFLLAATADPRVGRRLRSGLRWAALAIVFTCVAALAVQIHARWRALPGQALRADLCLGEYRQAVERAAEIGALDPELAELAACARELEDRAATSVIEAHARAELRAASESRAHAWLVLGALRGRADLAGVAEALERRSEEPRRPLSSSMPPELWERWAVDLARLAEPAR